MDISSIHNFIVCQFIVEGDVKYDCISTTLLNNSARKWFHIHIASSYELKTAIGYISWDVWKFEEHTDAFMFNYITKYVRDEYDRKYKYRCFNVLNHRYKTYFDLIRFDKTYYHARPTDLCTGMWAAFRKWDAFMAYQIQLCFFSPDCCWLNLCSTTENISEES